MVKVILKVSEQVVWSRIEYVALKDILSKVDSQQKLNETDSSANFGH